MDKRLANVVWKQFSERKLRSILTILGICIGIAALVSLILLSGALKSGITRQLERFDTDTILIAPKAGLAGSNSGPSGFGVFTSGDVDVVRQIPQIVKVYSLLRTNIELEFGREKEFYSIRGVPVIDEADEYAEFINQEILDGRYLQSDDVRGLNIGYRLAKEEFDREIFVGNTVKINGDKYTVVGIFVEEGDLSLDTAIFTNIESLRGTLGDSKAVTAISATIAPGADIVAMEGKIIRALDRYRGEEDFSTTTPQGIIDSVGELLGVVDIVVLSVALVSLFVASLGVTNSLFTSVFQRTKEIGTMKAVGAKNSQILSIFLFESSILGFFGGIIGTLVGLGLAFGFIYGINSFGFVRLEFAMDFTLIIGAIAFSTILGILAGSLPAYRASKLRPVDALRFE